MNSLFAQGQNISRWSKYSNERSDMRGYIQNKYRSMWMIQSPETYSSKKKQFCGVGKFKCLRNKLWYETFCAAAKIGIFNNGCYCQFSKTLKASGNSMKDSTRIICSLFHTSLSQIESINSDGSNRRTILTAKNRINRPTAMAIMDR